MEFELKVIDKKFSENSFDQQSKNMFELFYVLSKIYGPELTEQMYPNLTRGRTFRGWLNNDHEIVVVLLPVAD